jgi:DNA-binding beta-propeller fold protein YncE
MYWMMSISSFFVSSFIFTCCVDTKETEKTPHNPSQPIVVRSFSPDSGRVATQMLIHGENFGGYKEDISVFINEKKAVVIGVNPEGTLLYCLVPSLRNVGEFREAGDLINDAKVKIVVGNNESNVADKDFVYTFTQNVSTLLGYTDQDGTTTLRDGPFDKAQFLRPFWLAFDTDTVKDASGNAIKATKNIYLIEENQGLRFIDLDNRTVETIFRTNGDFRRPRTIAFTLNRDTMIIANDGDEWNWIGTAIIPRNPETRKFTDGTPQPWTVVMRHRQCNGGAIHPKTGDYWFNSYQNSQIYKVFNRSSIPWRYGKSANELNTDGQEGTLAVFRIQDDRWEFNIQIAPSGSFAYVVSKNQHYIAKIDYNYETNLFTMPATRSFVGAQQSSGYKDGTGTDARFNEPQQGAFDKDDNFYVCDGENNCIRMITPQGQVSTFAGRPGNPGYSDGALRDAQFDGPFGIIYDSEIQTFYIADRDNARIRTIKVE